VNCTLDAVLHSGSGCDAPRRWSCTHTSVSGRTVYWQVFITGYWQVSIHKSIDLSIDKLGQVDWPVNSIDNLSIYSQIFSIYKSYLGMFPSYLQAEFIVSISIFVLILVSYFLFRYFRSLTQAKTAKQLSSS
jgi:hypothetical protein